MGHLSAHLAFGLLIGEPRPQALLETTLSERMRPLSPGRLSRSGQGIVHGAQIDVVTLLQRPMVLEIPAQEVAKRYAAILERALPALLLCPEFRNPSPGHWIINNTQRLSIPRVAKVRHGERIVALSGRTCALSPAPGLNLQASHQVMPRIIDGREEAPHVQHGPIGMAVRTRYQDLRLPGEPPANRVIVVSHRHLPMEDGKGRQPALQRRYRRYLLQKGRPGVASAVMVVEAILQIPLQQTFRERLDIADAMLLQSAPQGLKPPKHLLKRPHAMGMGGRAVFNLGQMSARAYPDHNLQDAHQLIVDTATYCVPHSVVL